jgi:hypothetical protein
MPGVRDPREPRPELAEASPHYRADREKGAEEAVPPDVPTPAANEPQDPDAVSVPVDESGDGRSAEGDGQPPENEDEDSSPKKPDQ